MPLTDLDSDIHPLCQILPSEKTVSGPFVLFNGSFEIEFLQPDPQRNASTLFKATYKHGHVLNQKGKSHPQSPPLHIHFTQTESFTVLSGCVGTTATPGNGAIGPAKDQLHIRETTARQPHDIEPWTPHTFWPVSDTDEDTVLLLWATPEGPFPPMMDRAFFATLLRYLSDVSDNKVAMDIPQVMLNQ
ncbi:putative Cupin type-1 domain-containing protein [Seiridium cardinale]